MIENCVAEDETDREFNDTNMEEGKAMLVHLGRFPVYPTVADSLFGDLFGNFLAGEPGESLSTLLPLDVLENGNEVVVVAELPGVQKDDIKITLQEGVLTISGEKRMPGIPEEARRHRAERGFGKFSRSMVLPAAVDGSSVSAELKNGILRVVIPKAEQARPREIRVN